MCLLSGYGAVQGFHDWIMLKLDEGNNGHLFFEPTFAGAYSSTCTAFPGCCDMDSNFTSLDRCGVVSNVL